MRCIYILCPNRRLFMCHSFSTFIFIYLHLIFIWKNSSCVFCGFQSSKQETVEAHANKQHIGRQLKCPDCSFESYYKTNLQVHIKKVHGRKAENCIVPGCKFRSLFTAKIQVHLFSKHHGYYNEDRHSIMVPLK